MVRMSNRLEGKVALVTGASRGIGRAIALAFAREGADVVVNYVTRREEAESVGSEIKAIGRRVKVVKADMSIRAEVEEMIKGVVDDFEGIGILVNNAGVLNKGDLLRIEDNAIDQMMDVNVKGIIYCCRVASNYMKEQRYGKIINMSSIAAMGTALSAGAYSVSKAAVNTLTKKVALELGHYGINVNAIAPGLIKTDMTTVGFSQEQLEERNKMFSDRSMLRRVGDPEEVANLAVFLASDESNFITGQIIAIDGGRIDLLSYSA